jgi:hypothetical protein
MHWVRRGWMSGQPSQVDGATEEATLIRLASAFAASRDWRNT